MRSIEAERLWSRVVGHDRKFQLTQIEIAGKPPLADQTVALNNGLTVICGLNGVGKTSLLRLLEAALSGAQLGPPRTRATLGEVGSFRVSLRSGGSDLVLEVGDGSEAVPVVVLDAFELCGKVLQAATQTNFKDLFEGIEPHVFDQSELDRAAYLLGRRYEGLTVYEIEDQTAADGEEVLPIYIATVGGTEYSVGEMGLGELAGLEALWKIDHAETGSVLLVEEPETFLSSFSTTAFLDLVAQAIDERRLYAVVSTHAPEAIARCPLEAVRVVGPGESWSSVRISEPRSRADLEHLLRTVVGQSRVAVAEDKAAVVLVADLLGRYGGIWGQSLEVKGVGGEATVLSLCRDFPAVGSVRLVGVLDGDQPMAKSSRWPVLVLPGGGAPDELLRRAAESGVALFAERLGRPEETVEAVLTRLEGVDTHDWFAEAAKSLMLGEIIVIQAAISVWLSDGANSTLARQFITDLTGALIG